MTFLVVTWKILQFVIGITVVIAAGALIWRLIKVGNKKLIVINKVKRLRKAKGMTQEELAEAAYTTRQTIAAIENEYFNCSVWLARNIARALEETMDNVFRPGEDNGTK